MASLTRISKLEFRESDVSPDKKEIKQGNFVKFISPAKGYLRETYKSQNINSISSTPICSPWVSYKSKFTSFQCLVHLSVQFQYLTLPDSEVRGVCKVKVCLC